MKLTVNQKKNLNNNIKTKPINHTAHSQSSSHVLAAAASANFKVIKKVQVQSNQL